MAKSSGSDPKSGAIGNQSDSDRGRDKGGSKVKARINSEKTLKEIKRK